MDWIIGKVLYFFYPGSKASKGRQCNKVSMEILPDDGKPVSVVCTWFVRHPPLSVKTGLGVKYISKYLSTSTLKPSQVQVQHLIPNKYLSTLYNI